MRAVLILGAAARVSVTIARSLHRRGIPVIVAALTSEHPSIASKAIKKFVRLPDGRHAPQQCLAALLRIIRTEQCDMLIRTDDTALTIVRENYETLNELLDIGCPPPQVLQRVLDKNLTLETAIQCDIPIPTTYTISDAVELEALRGRLYFPVVAKPRSKYEVAAHNFKVRYFQSFGELAQTFSSDPHFGASNLLQEYCIGEGVGIGCLIHKREPLAMFQHRRVREFPATGGVSVLAISESLNPQLAEYAVKLLRALEWEGAAMVEFRYDRMSGKAALMEVNGRYWGSLSCAVHAGIDFPFYEWQLAHGQSPHIPSDYPVGMQIRWTTGDLLRLHALIVDPIPNIARGPSIVKEIVQFVVGFRPGIRSALWSLADPLPALSELAYGIKALLKTDAKGVIRKCLPPTLFNALRLYRILDPHVRSVYLKLYALRVVGLKRDHARTPPGDIQSILFVCHGNIIRSPMAAAMLRDALQRSNRGAVMVLSAGICAIPGAAADPRARIVAKELGISLEDHQAQLLSSELIERSDAIFVMDYLNEARVLADYPEARAKVFMLAGCDRRAAATREILDPYHGDISDVRRCYDSLQSHIWPLTDLLTSVLSPVNARSEDPLLINPNSRDGKDHPASSSVF